MLRVPQPDPRAVQALVKLCAIVPPPPRDQPQPPGVTLETSSLSHRHQTSSCPDLYPRVHGAALLGVVLWVEGAPAVSVVRVGHEASLQRVPPPGYQQVVSSAVHVTSLGQGIIVTSQIRVYLHTLALGRPYLLRFLGVGIPIPKMPIESLAACCLRSSLSEYFY